MTFNAAASQTTPTPSPSVIHTATALSPTTTTEAPKGQKEILSVSPRRIDPGYRDSDVPQTLLSTTWPPSIHPEKKYEGYREVGADE